jgi:hypothetical protein
VALLGGGADDPARDFAVKTFVVGGLEGFFYAPVLAGVERKDGDAASRVKALRQDAQEGVEGGVDPAGGQERDEFIA